MGDEMNDTDKDAGADGSLPYTDEVEIYQEFRTAFAGLVADIWNGKADTEALWNDPTGYFRQEQLADNPEAGDPGKSHVGFRKVVLHEDTPSVVHIVIPSRPEDWELHKDKAESEVVRIIRQLSTSGD
jgi:hypothetical protein